MILNKATCISYLGRRIRGRHCLLVVSVHKVIRDFTPNIFSLTFRKLRTKILTTYVTGES